MNERTVNRSEAIFKKGKGQTIKKNYMANPYVKYLFAPKLDKILYV